MKRTKLIDRLLPNYTNGEENFNMVSHIVGGGLGVVYLVMCVIVSALHHLFYDSRYIHTDSLIPFTKDGACYCMGDIWYCVGCRGIGYYIY